MIKTFLKHWIYEICICHFFDIVLVNFKSPHNMEHIKVGDAFECIVIQIANIEVRYYNASVKRVEKDFFTIAGKYFEERVLDDGNTSTGGTGYNVNIYKYDNVVKYLK